MLRHRKKTGGRPDKFVSLRMNNLTSLMAKTGYSYAKIGAKGVVDPKTVERAYKAGRATVRTVKALQKAFEITDADFLVLDWNLGNAPSGKELPIIIKVAAHLDDFLKAKQDESFAIVLKQIAAAAGVLAVIEIRPGCTEIEMTADADDVQRIYEAFEAGKLDHLGVVSISSKFGTETRPDLSPDQFRLFKLAWVANVVMVLGVLSAGLLSAWELPSVAVGMFISLPTSARLITGKRLAMSRRLLLADAGYVLLVTGLIHTNYLKPADFPSFGTFTFLFFTCFLYLPNVYGWKLSSPQSFGAFSLGCLLLGETPQLRYWAYVGGCLVGVVGVGVAFRRRGGHLLPAIGIVCNLLLLAVSLGKRFY